jgi:hypothetical protein
LGAALCLFAGAGLGVAFALVAGFAAAFGFAVSAIDELLGVRGMSALNAILVSQVP